VKYTAASIRSLLLMIRGFWFSQAIYVACALRIPDFLAKKSMSPRELSSEVGGKEDQLSRVLALLASVGLVRKARNGKFRLTEQGYLLLDQPGTLRHMALTQGQSVAMNAELLLESVRSGRSATEQIHGTDYFSFLVSSPDRRLEFDINMAKATQGAIIPLVENYPFPESGTLIDIGCGHGGVLIALLERYPLLKGVAFDRPETITQTRKEIKKSRLIRRCKLVGGDFFHSVPPGGSIYLLKHIIHDWDDEMAGRILRNVHKSMHSSSKLLLVENVISERTDASLELTYDIEMLLVLGGKERSRREFVALLRGAGFSKVKFTAIGASLCLILASK
jgi:hypothetical protein